MIFIGFKFMVLGGESVNLMVTLVMLMYAMMMASFLFGIAAVGEMVQTEVSSGSIENILNNLWNIFWICFSKLEFYS